MRNYKCLKKNNFILNDIHIEPIRNEDMFEIMKIRNEQIYHLRQRVPLTEKDQIRYFSTVIKDLFEQNNPNQLLFSFFENGLFVGYGGLVHINWIDKNAEISFVMKTELEKDHFFKYWSNFLKLIEELAFKEINLHKIYTYAFDLRPHLYKVLENCGYYKEAILKEHCLFNDRIIDVVYHSKINRIITFRKANESDMMLYFRWINDNSVRENSFKSEPISLEDHKKWFFRKIKEKTCFMIVFEDHLGIPIGQVRIDMQNENTAIISVSNDINYRGKGYSSKMIQIATEAILKQYPNICISAYIKIENLASEKAFKRAGYEFDTMIQFQGIPSYHYIKNENS